MAEEKLDLSSFDDITDRVARAKAKAEAVRKARGASGPVTPIADNSGDQTRSRQDKPEGAPVKEAVPPEEDPRPPQGVTQSSPPPRSIRPGQPRAIQVMEGGITTRRGFLSSLTLAWLAFTAASGAVMAAMGRLLFPNVLFETKQSFKIGTPDEYEVGVDTRWKNTYGVWVVRTTEEIFALLTTCTHLGCTGNWLETEEKFKCPCHGSGFYMSGINFEGPAPRPLERVRIILGDDGQIIVDKSRKFQFEKAEWDLPEASLKV